MIFPSNKGYAAKECKNARDDVIHPGEKLSSATPTHLHSHSLLRHSPELCAPTPQLPSPAATALGVVSTNSVSPHPLNCFLFASLRHNAERRHMGEDDGPVSFLQQLTLNAILIDYVRATRSGIAVSVGGPLFVQYIRPTDEEIFQVR